MDFTGIPTMKNGVVGVVGRPSFATVTTLIIDELEQASEDVVEAVRALQANPSAHRAVFANLKTVIVL